MSRTLQKTAFYITFITLISRLFGFIREAIIAYYFGASFTIDAYLIAISIPSIVFGCLLSVSVAFTPVYTRIKEERGRIAGDRLTSQIVLVLGILCLMIIILGNIFSEFIIGIAAPGFTGDIYNITIQYFRVAIWDLLFVAILNVYVAFLQCNGKFVFAAGAMLFHTSVQIIFTIAAGKLDAIYLVYGYVAADFMYLTAALFLSVKNGFRLRSEIFAERGQLKEILLLTVPIFFSNTITQINAYVDKAFGSMLPDGSISALNYSNIIKTFVVLMLNTGLVTVIYPLLSKHIVNGNIKEAKQSFNMAITYTVILFIPSIIGLYLLSEPVVSIIYGRGAFDSEAIQMTSSALAFYSLGILAIALRDIAVKFYYALNNSKTPLIISCLNIGINIALNFLLIETLKHAGLALATSIAATVTVPIYFTVLKKHIGAYLDRKIAVTFGKALVSAIIMGICIYFLKGGLHGMSDFLILISCTAIGIVIYFVLLWILKEEEIRKITKGIGRR